MGGCISAIKKMLKKNKETVNTIIDKLDEYDDIILDKVEDFLEDEIKNRTGMDVELGGYMDQVDNGITDALKAKVNEE